jgi:hypothetical protein
VPSDMALGESLQISLFDMWIQGGGEEEDFKPVTMGFRLDGLQGAMVAHVGHALEGGRHCALVALVASEAFPEGALEGAVFHWAVASREGGAWSPPPEGWQSDPSRSSAAGMPYSNSPDEAVCCLAGQPPHILHPQEDLASSLGAVGGEGAIAPSSSARI